MFTVADLRAFLANSAANLAAAVLVEDENGQRRGIESIGWPDAAREGGAREVILRLSVPPPEHDWENVAEAPIQNEVIDWCWRCGNMRHGSPIGSGAGTVFHYNVVGQMIGEDPMGAPTDEPPCKVRAR